MRKWIALFILGVFFANVCAPYGYPQGIGGVFMPPAGEMVGLSDAYRPVLLSGVKVYANDPMRFDFILDRGDEYAAGEIKIKDADRLIRYFMASLTIPGQDWWVNLSPYEQDRIVPGALGQTEMGRDLLAQDYVLKQITASLIYPEGETGKKFWKKVYAEAQKRYGITDIPVDTFNKVWILPEKAIVYENKNAAYVVESRLKVMLDSDYEAMANNRMLPAGRLAPPLAKERGNVASSALPSDPALDISKQVMHDVVIPILEKEVNAGKNFAQLRQVYQALILGAWYKKKITASLFSKVYVDQKKIKGISIDDPKVTEKIWGQYVEAFEKGVFNFIQEERNSVLDEVMPRKYFSGGMVIDPSQMMKFTDDDALISGKSMDHAEIISVRIDAAEKAEKMDSSNDGITGSNAQIVTDEDQVPQLTAHLIQERVDSLEEIYSILQKKEFLPTISLTDTHGKSSFWEEVLIDVKAYIDANKNNPDAKKLRVLNRGDLFDHGVENVRVFEIIKELKKLERKHEDLLEVHLLMGNHEWLFLRAMLGGPKQLKIWLQRGGESTLKEFKQDGRYSLEQEVFPFLVKHLEISFVDELKMLHVHAGLPFDKEHNLGISARKLKDLTHQWEMLKFAFMEEDNSDAFERVINFFEDKDLYNILWIRGDDWYSNIKYPLDIDEANVKKVKELVRADLKKDKASDESLEAHVEASWRMLLIVDPEYYRKKGIIFKVSDGSLSVEENSVMLRFLALTGFLGVIFGHEGFPMRISDRIWGTDSKDLLTQGIYHLDPEEGLVMRNSFYKEGMILSSYKKNVWPIDRMLQSVKNEIQIWKDLLQEPSLIEWFGGKSVLRSRIYSRITWEQSAVIQAMYFVMTMDNNKKRSKILQALRTPRGTVVYDAKIVKLFLSEYAKYKKAGLHEKVRTPFFQARNYLLFHHPVQFYKASKSLFASEAWQELKAIDEFDAAEMISDEGVIFDAATGGIDLMADKMPLEIRGGASGTPFVFDPEQIKDLRSASNFLPVIISIQPLVDLSQFLGVSVRHQ